MLLLMRRVGEIIRINQNTLIEIKQAKEDEVTFAIHSPEDEKKLNTLKKENENL